jgi:hypothetical protein
MVPAEVEGEIKDVLFAERISGFEIKKKWVMKYVHGDYDVSDVMDKVEQTLDLE